MGAIVVKYVYDAWGNHAVLDADGNDIEEANHIGNLNPFRYRGYYYDVETGLYFLQTRYYDPETGRFISQDSLDYADPETVNGLNLYAYCGNNPVMMTDETGTMPNWLKWLLGGILFLGAVALTALTGGALAPVAIGMGVSIVGGAVVGGVSNVIDGGNFWDGFLDGAADGALWGGIFALGGAVLRTAQVLTKGVVIGESMGRVSNAAKQIGAATYKSPGKQLVTLFGGKNATKIMLKQNQRWINRMVKWGVKITDIGIDYSRVIRSNFYLMESLSTRSYWNLFVQLLH